MQSVRRVARAFRLRSHPQGFRARRCHPLLEPLAVLYGLLFYSPSPLVRQLVQAPCPDHRHLQMEFLMRRVAGSKLRFWISGIVLRTLRYLPGRHDVLRDRCNLFKK
jgi:hypothetical protein